MSVGVQPNGARIARELALRGWDRCDLARAASLSRPTVTLAMRGLPIRPGSLVRIARALTNHDEISMVGELL